MPTTTPRRLAAIILPVSLALSACGQAGDGADTSGTIERTKDTLAAALSHADDLDQMSSALAEAQLSPLLDGSGTYTLLAPDDDAFTALGERKDELMTKEDRPVLVALLRDHILPGQVTPEAIETAIETKDGPVEMKTYGGGTVTFAKDDKGLTVTAGETTARIDGRAIAANNGAIVPLDTVLMPKRDEASDQ